MMPGMLTSLISIVIMAPTLIFRILTVLLSPLVTVFVLKETQRTGIFIH